MRGVKPFVGIKNDEVINRIENGKHLIFNKILKLKCCLTSDQDDRMNIGLQRTIKFYLLLYLQAAVKMMNNGSFCRGHLAGCMIWVFPM